MNQDTEERLYQRNLVDFQDFLTMADACATQADVEKFLATLGGPAHLGLLSDRFFQEAKDRARAAVERASPP